MGLKGYIAQTLTKKLEPRLSSVETRLSALERHTQRSIDSMSYRNGTSSIELARYHPLVRSSEDKSLHREILTESLGTNGLCLEIGPYFAPVVTGPNTRYFDVFDTKELKRRAEEDIDPAVTPQTVPTVHYTDPDGDISAVPEKFCEAVSSHCIEHQPDFVGHLEKVYDLLEDGGRYVVFVPDKRFCLDHFAPISSLGDVIEASNEKRVRHSLSSIVNMIAGTTHNDPKRHWAGDHFDPGYYEDYVSRAALALETYRSSDGKYIDCHAWYFTPASFAVICERLHSLSKIRLQLEAVGSTRVNTSEFTAVFRR